MIENVRAFLRLIVFFLLTFGTVISVAAGNILFGFLKPSMVAKWKNRIITLWASLTAKILGLTITSEGSSPKPPFFLVSNHLSYIDIVPLWYLLDGTFIAKSEVASWPFFGWGTRTLGVLFINRKLQGDVRRMNNRIAETITDSKGIILFPEGTSSKGEKVLPFNSSLLHYPAKKEMPVSCVAISYRSSDVDRPAWSHVCWWGDMAFLPHFWELLKIKQINITVRFGDKLTANDRKELSKQLHEQVSQLFIPIVDPQN
ncbi:lysophospholipid acyltransferase family protein [Fodinibius sp.]|uniref:lysophospholipid acyltransferase family protein n=1 Tax=Fodinibius sp. TaxID=1872440 RepID=UPI002ACE056E|nr:lysophospholipid acyltransferase family protein [Fodinibius sp.]